MRWFGSQNVKRAPPRRPRVTPASPRVPAQIQIRAAASDDWEAIWPFFRTIVRAGETYSYDREMTFEQGRDLWMERPPGRTFVAVDEHDTVIGSASLHPNRGGGGAHVASASFMVDPQHARRGAGRALGEHVLEQARADGYRAMQFNSVIESNTAAVTLWRSLGFEILATVPQGFDHPVHGYVGLLIMFRTL